MRMIAGCAAARSALSTKVSETSVVARPLGKARLGPCAATDVAIVAERVIAIRADWYVMGGGDVGVFANAKLMSDIAF